MFRDMEILMYLCGGIEHDGRSLADFVRGKRKVRAIKGAVVVNGNLSAMAEQRDRK